MTVAQLAQFCLLALLWGVFTRAGMHYAEVLLQTYRAKKTELWFRNVIWPHLQ